MPFFGDAPLSKIDSFSVERHKKQPRSEPSLRGGDRVSEKAMFANGAHIANAMDTLQKRLKLA